MWKFIVMAAAVAMLALAAIAIAKTVLWKWVDKKGNVHYAEYLDQVPAKYRDKAVKVVIEGSDNQSSSSGGGEVTSTKKKKVRSTSKKKGKWQTKAVRAYEKVEELYNQVKSLEKKCPELRRKALNMPVIANTQASAQCYENLKKLKKDLDRARKYLEQDIYDEAHEAGVPPKWIDEAIEAAKSGSKKKK